MDTSLLQTDDALPTGTVNMTRDARNKPDYFIAPDVAYDFIEITAESLATAARADCICFGTLIQRQPASRRTLLNLLDASPEIIAESLARADVLKLNEAEAQQLGTIFDLARGSITEFAVAAIARWQLDLCVITLGERGVLAVSAKSGVIYIPGHRISVVDTCGAGDAFTAGFVHWHLRGHPLAECCQFGNARGALVAAQRGATAPIAVTEIQKLLRHESPRIIKPALLEYRRE